MNAEEEKKLAEILLGASPNAEAAIRVAFQEGRISGRRAGMTEAAGICKESRAWDCADAIEQAMDK